MEDEYQQASALRAATARCAAAVAPNLIIPPPSEILCFLGDSPIQIF